MTARLVIYFRSPDYAKPVPPETWPPIKRDRASSVALTGMSNTLNSLAVFCAEHLACAGYGVRPAGQGHFLKQPHKLQGPDFFYHGIEVDQDIEGALDVLRNAGLRIEGNTVCF